ncbi:MAG: hypothetical protein KAS66_15520 [Candidatus Omnitrophica bacterium]|nr:hypothetical protein [Candidatus Omnitrophota bacterium]
MITKFVEWDDEPQEFVRKSVDYVINHRGFVFNTYTGKTVSEDFIHLLLESGDVMNIDRIIEVLLNEMPPLNTVQKCAIDRAVWFLEHNQ